MCNAEGWQSGVVGIFNDVKWASYTHGNEEAYLIFYKDGNLALYSNGGSIFGESRNGEH